MKLIDLTGQKFGLLTVLERGKNSKDGHVRWNCVCDCGKVKDIPVSAHDLKSGAVISCGCIHLKSITKHGHSHERIFYTWHDMIRRCENPHSSNYCNYGGRGISVCEEWHDFMVFRDWALKNGYADNLSIDRIDCNKGYYPENCRFANTREQANNRRNNTRIVINNEAHTLAEWARIANINYSTLRLRYQRGISGKDLLSPTKLVKRTV